MHSGAHTPKIDVVQNCVGVKLSTALLKQTHDIANTGINIVKICDRQDPSFAKKIVMDDWEGVSDPPPPQCLPLRFVRGGGRRLQQHLIF